MVRFQLEADDLADTRFAISPIADAACSLWALADPRRYALHAPWLRFARAQLPAADLGFLLSLVGPSLALPDFITPRPAAFAPSIEDELATVRGTAPQLVRRDLIAVHAPSPLPGALADAASSDDEAVEAVRDAICLVLQRYWETCLKPIWPQLRLVLEADVTYRARRLAAGGARLLFADLHPNVRWHDGVLHIGEMIGRHEVDVSGRGLLLVPSAFAYKPVPPLISTQAPWVVYPSRGVGTLWSPAPAADGSVLESLLGAPRARLLRLLEEPLSTSDLARRQRVTPSAVSQHLRILRAAGLVTRARDGRYVLHRRSRLGDELVGG